MMHTKKTIFLFLACCVTTMCDQPIKKLEGEDKKISDELLRDISRVIDSLYTADQYIQKAHIEAIKTGGNEKIEELALQQKTIFENHIPILKNVYGQIGYPCIDLVGKERSSKFFTLVQHADADVKFQEKMLKSIRVEVQRGNVSAQNYALLTDRVQLAHQKPQIYGTQVQFDTQTGQAFPKPLMDSIHVNNRRKEIGIEPLEVYLNKISKWHFEMNKTHYNELGIKKP